MLDVARYIDLFVHRRDVFAEQQSHGAYFPGRQPITEGDVREHLAGMASYGVYVIEPMPCDGNLIGQTITYLMFDLDTHDEKAQEWLVHSVEHFLIGRSLDGGNADKRCLLYERSGNKGTHVWLFFDGPVNAAQARRWVARDFMPRWDEAAKPNHWPLEVFPKQDTVDAGGYGNLVKLPLGKHAVSGNFSEFMVRNGWASGVHDVVPLPAALVPNVPESEVPGARSSNTIRRAAGDGPQSPFPCVDAIIREGVGKGMRDLAMFHVALYFYGHGLDQDLAEEMCLRANENFDPPMSEKEVRAKVAAAYRGRYQSARCGTDWLRDVCPGPCRDGWSVRQVDAGSLRRSNEGDVVEVTVLANQFLEGKARVTVTHPDASNTPTFVVDRGDK